MSRLAKKKRQQRAQSRQANALFKRQQREQHQKTAALRAEKGWNKTLRQLTELGATLQERQMTNDGKEKMMYQVSFEGKVHQFGTRFRLQRWLKQEQERQEERNMSWAERHVRWMIENNCDDHGNRWIWDEPNG